MAARLGVVNVERDILAALTAKQFRRWQHYASLEPFDETRADYRAAAIVAMVHNMLRGKGSKVMSLEDAVLKFGEAKAGDGARRFNPQTPKEQLEVLKVLSIMQAAAEKKG